MFVLNKRKTKNLLTLSSQKECLPLTEDCLFSYINVFISFFVSFSGELLCKFFISKSYVKTHYRIYSLFPLPVNCCYCLFTYFQLLKCLLCVWFFRRKVFIHSEEIIFSFSSLAIVAINIEQLCTPASELPRFSISLELLYIICTKLAASWYSLNRMP